MLAQSCPYNWPKGGPKLFANWLGPVLKLFLDVTE
jgi:hypothetical protein